MYVIAGASGHTGRVVAETLLAQRQPVRVIVRDAARGAPWKAKGAEVAVASLGDAIALGRALAGAQGAYLLVPPHSTSTNVLLDQARVVDAIAAAVRSSGVPHVVALSSLGAGHESGTGPIRSLYRLEQALARSANNVTFLRAAYFAENTASALGEALKSGVFHTFLTPGRAIPMVATADVGRTAAELLLDPAKGVRIVELVGPAEHTPEAIAKLLAKLAGRAIQPGFAPLEFVVPALTAAGMTRDMAELLREMFSGINGGKVALSAPPALVRKGTVGAEEVLRGLLQAVGA